MKRKTSVCFFMHMRDLHKKYGKTMEVKFYQSQTIYALRTFLGILFLAKKVKISFRTHNKIKVRSFLKKNMGTNNNLSSQLDMPNVMLPGPKHLTK